jgi:hypothetical protein
MSYIRVYRHPQTHSLRLSFAPANDDAGQQVMKTTPKPPRIANNRAIYVTQLTSKALTETNYFLFRS